MSRPKVTPSNQVEVYRYYGDRDPNPRFARFGHWAVSRLLRPEIAFAQGAEDAIAEHLAADKKLVIVTNHTDTLDPFHVAAAMWQKKVFSPMITRTVIAAKPSLFRYPIGRQAIDELGGFPAFRAKDVIDADERTRAQQQGAAEGMIKTATEKINRGYHLTMFPEGQRGGVPLTVQPLKRGLGAIASGVGVEHGLAVLPGGFYYDEQGRRAPVLYFEEPILEGERDAAVITGRTHSVLQHCVNQAAAKAA